MGKNLAKILGLSALALAAAGCGGIPTNTANISERTKSHAVAGYKQYSIRAEDKSNKEDVYMALAVPIGKTPKVGEVVLNRGVLLDQYLIPYSESTDTERGRKIRTESEIAYALANVVYNNGKVALNTGDELQATRVIFDRKNLETKIKNGEYVRNIRTPRAKKEPSTVTLGEGKEAREFYIMDVEGEQIEGVDRLQILLMDKVSEPVTRIIRSGGQTQTEFSLQGFQYVPVKVSSWETYLELISETPATPETVSPLAEQPAESKQEQTSEQAEQTQ